MGWFMPLNNSRTKSSSPDPSSTQAIHHIPYKPSWRHQEHLHLSPASDMSGRDYRQGPFLSCRFASSTRTRTNSAEWAARSPLGRSETRSTGKPDRSRRLVSLSRSGG
ncbi:hypothetical protein VTK56DRAFT_5403 [Thermocarpiscus australiensis]